jgi:hypothetical protein
MSPFFFLAAGLLQCIINKAHAQGLLSLPIPSYDNAGYPIIQYANDTIIVKLLKERSSASKLS